MKKVVIVEDDLWLARQYERLLKKAGYETWTVAHAVGAIDLIDEHMPDVIVADLMLVGATALTLLHELQSHHDLAAIPVVLVSSASEAVGLADVAPYGVVRVLDKTEMVPDDVVSAVRAAA